MSAVGAVAGKTVEATPAKGAREGTRAAGAAWSAGLEGLRGFAALSVLAFHVWLYRNDRPRAGRRSELLDHVMFNLHLGLFCFFVLSGFLLWRAFASAALDRDGRVATGPYLRRRLARIVPAYWASILGCIALYAAFGLDAEIPSLAELPRFLLFIQTYWRDTLFILNPVLWTLCVEMAFYLLLPILGAAAIALGRGRAWRQAGLLAGLIAVNFAWNAAFYSERANDVERKVLPAYLGCFAVGMLVALWVERRERREAGRLGTPATGLLFVAGTALVVAGGAWKEIPHLLDGLRAPFANFVPSVGFALIVAAVVAGSGRWSRAPGVRPLAAAGVVSYGTYLWHVPLIVVMWDAGLLPHALAPRLAVVAAVSLAVGLASWRLVERPCIGWAAGRRHRQG